MKFPGDSLLIQVEVEPDFVGTGGQAEFGLFNGRLERLGQMGLAVGVNRDIRLRMVQRVFQ